MSSKHAAGGRSSTFCRLQSPLLKLTYRHVSRPCLCPHPTRLLPRNTPATTQRAGLAPHHAPAPTQRARTHPTRLPQAVEAKLSDLVKQEQQQAGARPPTERAPLGKMGEVALKFL